MKLKLSFPPVLFPDIIGTTTFQSTLLSQSSHRNLSRIMPITYNKVFQFVFTYSLPLPHTPACMHKKKVQGWKPVKSFLEIVCPPVSLFQCHFWKHTKQPRWRLCLLLKNDGAVSQGSFKQNCIHPLNIPFLISACSQLLLRTGTYKGEKHDSDFYYRTDIITDARVLLRPQDVSNSRTCAEAISCASLKTSWLSIIGQLMNSTYKALFSGISWIQAMHHSFLNNVQNNSTVLYTALLLF